MKFRKKATVVIEAEQFRPMGHPLPFRDEGVCNYADGQWFINTIEGRLHLTDGDWIIKGVRGEFYPIKDDIFQETYEAAPDVTVTDTTRQCG